MNRLTEALLDWYADNKRDLPWRGTTDPYRIWISEIILQQTRVVQGYEYFLRFIRRFPDVRTLASASEDEVLKYWQGLGYYSRARNLHAAAKSMNGKFPESYQEVRALKGVGDYTAAAICSIAYNMPYAVVDGNVYRVLSRYCGIDVPIDSTEGKKLCTPQSPNCMFCPLADSCSALSKGQVMQLPVKQHRTKTSNRYFNYIYVRMGACTFIHKRTADDIWKNLFELPLVEADRNLSEEEFLSSASFRSLIAEGEVPEVRLVFRNVKHVLSHRVIYANFYEVVLPENSRSFSEYQCIRMEDLEQYPVSRLVHAFLEKYL